MLSWLSLLQAAHFFRNFPFCPLDPLPLHAPRAPLAPSRWLWQAIQRPAWSPDTHHLFLPRFKKSVRTLLLVAHRAAHGSRGSLSTDRQQGGQELAQPAILETNLLAALPQDVLHCIISLAAYPVSSWMSPPSSS